MSGRHGADGDLVGSAVRAASGRRGVCLKDAPDVTASAALIDRKRKRRGGVRQQFGVTRRAFRAVCNEARERAVFQLECRSEDATAGRRDNRVGHGHNSKKESEP